MIGKSIGLLTILCFLFLTGCKNHLEGAENYESLVARLADAIKSGSWNDASKLFLNPDNIQPLDMAILLAPKDGNLISDQCVSLSKARREWADMNDFFEKKAEQTDKVMKLGWEYPTEHGIAELEQYYLVVVKEGRFFLKL